jgi:hypothetical protein
MGNGSSHRQQGAYRNVCPDFGGWPSLRSIKHRLYLPYYLAVMSIKSAPTWRLNFY